MWAKIKALPLLVKIIALVVFIALGGIYKTFIAAPSSSGGYNSSYSPVSASSAGSAGSSVPASSGGSSAPASSAGSSTMNASQVLASLEAQYSVMQNQNVQCAAQEQQMNPSNFAPPPCEAQMQVNVAQMAKLEAEIYRLKTGANVQPVDFVLMGSSSPSGGGGATSDPAQQAVERADREGILGQSKYTDSDGKEYQLANSPYYFKDRVSGNVVASNTSNPPDNQHDWEQLTYQPN